MYGDRRQVTADEGMSIDRGRTGAEDRTQRLVDEFSTHVDRRTAGPTCSAAKTIPAQNRGAV